MNYKNISLVIIFLIVSSVYSTANWSSENNLVIEDIELVTIAE